ncbi:MAG: hypothetical protein N2111_13870 [Candidatus Sumerlaeaceae bacterium]|nr:hypothetical protein [Candidatus Sumerlaeaceae bacterium]
MRIAFLILAFLCAGIIAKAAVTTAAGVVCMTANNDVTTATSPRTIGHIVVDGLGPGKAATLYVSETTPTKKLFRATGASTTTTLGFNVNIQVPPAPFGILYQTDGTAEIYLYLR